jgi:CheY-like chemotaxis protein
MQPPAEPGAFIAMPKRVLDVGNCSPDHNAIKQFLRGRFDCDVRQVHDADDALAVLGAEAYDLVLVNRKLDKDYSDGIDVIRRILHVHGEQAPPVMLVTNYADAQDAAVAVGAQRGFGKLQFGEPETIERLQAVLDE